MKSAMRLRVSLLLLCALLKISQASCDKDECAENVTQTLTVNTTAVVFGLDPKCNLSSENGFTGEGSLTGLTPGVVYAVFIGCSNCCHQITTKPETVVGLNVTETTTSSISLSWTPLLNIITYRVNYTNGTTHSDDLTVTESEVTVTGLTAGVQHSFTVRAVANDNTTEGDSATVTAYTKPGKVWSPVVSTTNSSISLTWSPPPGDVLEYRVFWHNGGTMMDNSTTSLSAVLPNLISGTTYTIQIVAVNGAKELGEPHILTAVTKPAAVKNLTVTAVTSSSVSLSWIEPDGNASSYLVQWTLGGKTISNTSFVTSFTIEDLTPGTQYSITVSAVADNSTNTGVGTSTTTFTKPVKPVDIVVNQRTTDKMNISWTLSKGRVDHFMVNISNEELMYSNSSTTTDDTFLFTGLRPGREFAITVTAVAGEFSEMSDQTSFATYPTPPGDIVVTQRTNSSLHLSWGTPPLMDDVSGITYHITYQSQAENGGAAQNETSNDENVDLSSLSSGTNYSITVQTVGPQSLKSSESVISAFTSPNPVFNLECSHKSTTSVTVAWSAPQGAQDYYTYSVQTSGSAGALINETTRTDLSGLEPGTRYNISVRTIATADIQSMDEFTTCFTMPTAVLNLKVENVTTTSVQLSWHKQNDYKSTYTYMVRALLGDILVHNATANTQTYTFTGLDPGHFYTFEVITKLDWVNSSEARTSTYTRPAVVTNILTTGSMDSLSVSWTLAEGQVDSYSVLLHSEKDPGKNSTDLSNSTVNEVFKGLKAGVEYCVEVITLRGPFQNSSPRVCNATFPRPPGPITVQSQTVDSINFTWSLPEDMDHMQYNFSVSTLNDLFLTTENHFLLNNLLSGSPYDISVVSVGALNYESSAQRSQNYTRPHPVTVLVNMTDITTDTVALFWTQRESKPHYSYEVKSSISADPEVIVNTTKTFTGLDSGSNYSFTITTQTEDGTQAAPVTVSFFTRPHGVRQLQAETLNTTAVHLFFTGPLEYKPEYSYRAETSGCDTHRNETFAGNDTVISELTQGTNCTFCVVVRAADGIEGEANCISQYTKPETVQPQISSQGSNSSVLVSWDKHQGRVESFIVQLNSTSEPGKIKVLDSSKTSIRFDGLSAGQIYRAMVTSQSGNFREPSEVVTSATFPNPPGPIEVLKKTISSIDIEWGEAPRMSNVSFFYNLTIVSSEGGENISLNNTSHAFTSLRSGTPYNISLVTVGALAFQSELVQIHGVTTRPFDVRSLQVSDSSTEDTLIATWANPDQYQESYTFNLTLQGPGGPSTDVTKDNRFEFTGLDPGSQYSISVTTETSDGTQSDPRRTSACTKASPVHSLMCDGPNRPTAELVLSWNCPPGDYSGFQVRVDNRVDSITNGQSSLNCTRTVSNLRHYTNYSMTVETQSCGLPSDRSSITCQTGITDPPAPENPQLVQIKDKEHFRFSLQINSSLLNNTNGPIRYVGVLVTDSSPDNSDFRKYLGQNYSQWKGEKTQAYLATVKETSLQTRSAETQLIINVGDGSSWKGYTNGPLTSNRKYRFAIVLFTDLNLENQLVNGSLSLVSSTQFSFIIDLPMNPTVVGLAVGATLGIFCILFIVLLGFIIYWKRMSKKESQEVQVVTLSTPVRVEEFEDYYKRQKADSNCGFAEEFEELKVVGTGQAKTHALAPENKPKNRYNNVLPYDSSRVKLSIIHGSPHDDYINANYMPGYNSSKEFIAAQGPLPQTVNEFWRMIWEKNVQTLVMLTRCNEQGRVKCEQYWEHGTKHFENIIVTTTSEIPLKDWTIRDFDVKNVKTAETRSVRHFHFTAWPDHGVPETTELLISFRHLVREHMDQYSRHSPAVVHCSAGVGRTGTLIAIDRLINQIERENLVDVYGIVRDLRMHRPLMVQTEDQYVFLNQCAMDIIRSRTGTNVDLIYQNMAALSIYENVEPKKGFNRNGYNNA